MHDYKITITPEEGDSKHYTVSACWAGAAISKAVLAFVREDSRATKRGLSFRVSYNKVVLTSEPIVKTDPSTKITTSNNSLSAENQAFLAEVVK